MSRYLIGAVPFLVVIPHLIPLPDYVDDITSRGVKSNFKDDGQRLPSQEQLEQLAKNDPIAFQQACLRRYDREVKGYTFTLHKQERIAGRLGKKEVIEGAFREKPHSVYLHWKEGAKLASKVIYVEGENEELTQRKDEKVKVSMVVVKPAGLAALAGLQTRDPKGKDARNCGRYTLDEFGIRVGSSRTLGGFETAKKEDALKVEYLGKKKVEELNGRECFILKRQYKEPDVEGVGEQTLYVDVETWVMIGTVLREPDGQLVAEYFFRDVRLNPEFDKDQFSRKILEK